MPKCGSLTDNNGNVSGTFLSWQYPAVTLALREIKNRPAGKSPTHDVIAKAPHGGWVDIGSAWKNKIQKGDKSGSDCYSLTLDEPTMFDKPVKLSAFPATAGAKEFALEFDRSEKPAAAVTQTTAQDSAYQFESEKNAA